MNKLIHPGKFFLRTAIGLLRRSRGGNKFLLGLETDKSPDYRMEELELKLDLKLKKPFKERRNQTLREILTEQGNFYIWFRYEASDIISKKGIKLATVPGFALQICHAPPAADRREIEIYVPSKRPGAAANEVVLHELWYVGVGKDHFHKLKSSILTKLADFLQGIENKTGLSPHSEEVIFCLYTNLAVLAHTNGAALSLPRPAPPAIAHKNQQGEFPRTG